MFKLHGIPIKDVSDRDLAFTKAFITELCALVGACELIYTFSSSDLWSDRDG